MKKLLKKGFTLLELLIVIVILGLLTSLVSFSFLSILGSASAEAAKIDIDKINQGVIMYKLKNNKYPTQEQGILSLVEEGHLSELPEDPWGNDYVYVYPGQYGEYDIISLGADGEPGGEGENADIRNE